MGFERTGVNFLNIEPNQMLPVATRDQFEGAILIEAGGRVYSQPKQWGVVKLVNTEIPPDMTQNVEYQQILYDRCTLIDTRDSAGDFWDTVFVYVTKESGLFVPAIAVWDITII